MVDPSPVLLSIPRGLSGVANAVDNQLIKCTMIACKS